MKRLIIIVDCSGSIIADDTVKVGQINDLVRDLIDSAQNRDAERIQVVCYANGAKIYWDSSTEPNFYDLGESRFGGRSNLGQAYLLIAKELQADKADIGDCVIALVSDGEATDNYKKQLAYLDAGGRAVRTALSIGSSKSATEKHASAYNLAFSKGVSDRDAFIDATVEALED